MGRGALTYWRAAPHRCPGGLPAGPTATLTIPSWTAPDGMVISPRALIDTIRGYDPDANLGVVTTAFEIASAAHAMQQRDNREPYITHPLAVAEILAGNRLDVGRIPPPLLHDVIEDPGTPREGPPPRAGPEIPPLFAVVTQL